MKLLFGHHGLRGDLVINLPAIQYLHKKYNYAIDLPIHKQFADMAPLFLNHTSVNSVFITDEYEKFPNEKDQRAMFNRGYTHIANPMQPHARDDWHQHMHQVDAVLYDYTGGQETLPEDEKQINLFQWFDAPKWDKIVTFAPFAGYAYNKYNEKMLTEDKANKICDYIVGKGYDICQLGGHDEPKLRNAFFPKNSYFDSVRMVLGSDLLIHADTGIGWVCSGYKHKQLGLYSHAYYSKECVKNIQPVNPNSMYLDAPNVNDIPDEEIFEAIDNILS